MKYSDQIKDPRWQKFRLFIFERDNYKCRCCNNDKEQLHTHHLYYLPNTMAWDYDAEGVVTVCSTCHEILTKELGKIAGIIAFDILCKKIQL